MFLRTIPVAAWAFASCLALAPRPAGAQESVFAAAVRELAANPDQPAAARLKMQAALTEWDRQIEGLEAPHRPARGESFERHLAVGLAYRSRGRLDDALRQFDAAAALNAGASDVHVLRGLTLEAAARREDAGRAFHAAWRRDPDNPVKAYLVLGRTDDLDAADRKRTLDVLRKAFHRVLAGDHRPAATPFLTLDLVPDALSRTPIVGEGALAGVFARLAEGRLNEAIAAFDEGNLPVALRGPAPQGTSALARGRAAEAEGRFGDARREYAVALAGTLAGRHALYVGIGRLAQVQGEADAAIEAFDQAVRLSPNAPVVHRELAAAYLAAGRADDAFAELVAALLIAPDDADALAAVGQLYLDTDREAEAIPVLQRVLTVRADRYETHYALAVALSRAGRTGEAAREFERFERLSRQALEDRRRAVAGEPGPVSPKPRSREPGPVSPKPRSGGGGAREDPR
jgi:tetratricopeptide (TPR) repeat protein